ncbi:acyl carrier protein [Streptomyces sp. NPDC048751]|uniref:acyl carrier protein n=1 Tax=Streptomyces sp. NPDC048751 TaxID=3365591 RepID=UPI003723CEEC
MPPEGTASALDAAEQTVVEALGQLLDADEDALGADTPLSAIEGWDSVNALRVLVFLERELGSPVDYERFAAAGSVGDLGALVADTAGGGSS